jgi:hypothetical protein
MKLYTNNHIDYKVGTNAKENWDLISKADRAFYWVHLEGVPSAHVIIEIDDILQEDLTYAAKLCRDQSGYPNAMPCVATTIDNIKFGSKLGEVYFKRESDVISFMA